MGQLKHNIGKKAQDLAGAEPAIKRYNGPTPPKDVYKGVIKQLKVPSKTNRNGDYMITGLVEIAEKSGTRKAKYNGYAIWFRQNVSDQGAPYVNQMLDAISGGDPKYRSAFWEKFVATDDKDMVTRIGGKRYADGTLEVVISAKDGSDQNGGRRLEIGAWLTKTESEAFESDAGDDDEDEDEDLDDDVELEEEEDNADDDEDDESDDSDEDDDDDDDSEEDDDSDADDDEDDDEEDEDDEDDEEDSEDEAEDDDGERLRELEAMTRPELAKVAKSLSIKVLKSKDNAKLIAEILEAEDDEAPF